MNLAPFTDIAFDEPEALEDFRFALQTAHDKIASVLFKQGKVYHTYPLIDADGSNKDWQQNLQSELSSIYSLLGFTGLPDFAGADLNQENDFTDFLLSLQLVERRINAQLGIQ